MASKAAKTAKKAAQKTAASRRRAAKRDAEWSPSDVKLNAEVDPDHLDRVNVVVTGCGLGEHDGYLRADRADHRTDVRWDGDRLEHTFGFVFGSGVFAINGTDVEIHFDVKGA